MPPKKREPAFQPIQFPEGESLTCINCGNELGKIFTIGDGEEKIQVMQLGGVLVYELQGLCAKCGMGVWQSVNARRLQRLLSKIVHSSGDKRK